MQYHHVQPDERVNVTPRHPLKEFASYIGGILVLFAVVYGLCVLAVELAIPYITPEMEAKIFGQVSEQLILPDVATPADAVTAREQKLQALLDRIPKDGLPPYPYKVIYVDDAEVNALALPSGKIVIYRGLLDSLHSENGLTFVLGHELGHFAHRDHLRGMGVSLLTTLLLLPILGGDGDVGGLLSGMKGSFDMKYSRSQESKADAHGLKALVALYGHAGGATELFTVLAKEDKLQKWLEFLSTHPASQERIAALESQIQEQHLKIGALTPRIK